MRHFVIALALVLGTITTATAEEPVDILDQPAPTTAGQCPAFDVVIGVLQTNAQNQDPAGSADTAELRARYAGFISYGDSIAIRAPGTDDYAWTGLRTLLNAELQGMAIAEAHDADLEIGEDWFIDQTRAHLAAGHFLAGVPNYNQ